MDLPTIRIARMTIVAYRRTIVPDTMMLTVFLFMLLSGGSGTRLAYFFIVNDSRFM